MKRIFSFAVIAILLASCAPKNQFRIHGYVSNPDLEGACIFLVPATEPVNIPSKDNLDSTFIKDQKFEFKGEVERLGDLRIEAMRRIGTQNLLVVTEPGDIYVTIGEKSSGYGTRQNDSLEVWKNLTESTRSLTVAMLQSGCKEEADSTHAAYKSRSQNMAHALGDDSTLGKFLLSLYPDKK